MKSFFALKPNSTRDTFLTPENIALAKSFGDVYFAQADANGKLTPECIAEQIAGTGADVYFTGWGSPRLDEAILQAAPDVRLLAHLCGTVVPFTSAAQWDRGIRVISGNDFFAESVAEGTIAYMLTALRRIPKYSSELKEKQLWKKTDSYTEGLLGRTVGVVSYGTISRILVRMLSVFRVKIKVYDIVPLPEEDVKKYGLQQASIEEIFSTCDIITVHTPLFDATRHLITRRLFDMIPEGALFVNTSRGAVLDQEALIASLEDGRFRAVLDVYEKEPPEPGCRLYTLPNVIMMPHMAGPTVDLRKYIAHEIILDAAGFIDRGEQPKHEITRQKAASMSVH